MSELRLDEEQLERIASLVAEQLKPAVLPGALVDVAAVAAYLNVDPSWVYAHKRELGVRKLGDGPKAPLRFSLAEVDERLSACSEGRGSREPELAPALTKPRRRRRPMGTSVDLLPIRGRHPAERGAA